MTSNAVAAAAAPKTLVEKFAGRYAVEPAKLLATLKNTAFRQQGDKTVSNEEMMALLVVADQHGLNPFTKEIYAFADSRAGVVPIVGVDGWNRICNEHPQYNGIEFRYADEDMTVDADHKPCPAWCEAIIYRKDRDHAVVVREYLDEVYQGKRGNYKGPWQTHTKRMLRHKAMIQAARVAFGFSGIYDEDEAKQIMKAGETIDITPAADVTEAAAASTRSKLDVLAGPEPVQEIDVSNNNEQGEITDGKITAMIMRAKTEDDINEALDLSRELDEKQRATIQSIAEAQRESILNQAM